jgi:type II secretory ATPase GspE/PulE/Tfp pilus assembly ATPase PilB-like protein
VDIFDEKETRRTGADSLIERLLEEGDLNPFQARIILKEVEETLRSPEELCLEMGFVSADRVAVFLEELRGFPEVDLSKTQPDLELVFLLSRDLCMQREMVPLYQRNSEWGIALAQVEDPLRRDKIAALFPGKKIRFFGASAPQVQEVLQAFDEEELNFEKILQAMDQKSFFPSGEGSVHPTVYFVNALLRDALRHGASDLHCEPEKFFVRVRYRCDGLLKVMFDFHRSYWNAILARFKILSDMDIAETHHPQDGRFTQQVLGKEIDFRVASHPTVHGENLVVRLLERERACRRLWELGHCVDLEERLRERLRKPEGLMIVTGPTGSGKTTSLYAFAQEILSDEVNIMTLEEPIEYQVPFLRQTEVRERVGFHFAEGVRSILRQDPDGIVIGEIRDPETAQMALRAVMSGRRVLTSLHTADAIGAVFRLTEFGVPLSFLSGNINCVLAQRLVRKLCPDCKKPLYQEERISPVPSLLFQANGCIQCSGKGYRGRFAVAELLVFDDDLEAQFLKGRTRVEIASFLQRRGHKTLWCEGLQRVATGETSLQELERVLGEFKLLDGERLIP